MSDRYAARCPQCGSTEGLVRVSAQTAVYTQPVKALRWWGPGRVRVEADGEKTYVEEGVRTVAICCTRCGMSGDPARFADGIASRQEVNHG